MANFIYSTATCAGIFVDYAPSKDVGIPRMKVRIAGGHGVASQFTNGQLGSIHTPRGAVTQVSDEELAFLMSNKNFLKGIDDGFFVVDTRKVDTAKRAEGMADKDGSAPLTPADFEEGENSTKEEKIYKKKEINPEITPIQRVKGRK